MAAQRAYTTHPLVVRRVTVRRIHEVTPRMRRIVVGGDGLGSITRDGVTHPPFAAPGFDDHLKLIFAADGDVHAALPAQLPHGIEWGPSEHRQARDYTPRRFDPVAGELDLDFVLHGDGPAAEWASRAGVGDELWFVGPKSSLKLPDELDWIVLIGDETALPAIGRYLDERPHDAPAHVLVTVSHDEARQELALRDGDTIAWVVAEPGDAEALDAAVRAVELPDGDGYAWAAAESRALLPVRRYLQRERGLAKDRVNITGYWHRESVADASAAPGSDKTPAEAGEIPSPLPWLVTRAALQLGVIDAVADAPGMPVERLAERVGVASGTLAMLLPVLTAHGVLAEAADGELTLGPAGEELLDEHEREELDGPEADLLLALGGLASSIRAGESPWRTATGTTLAESARAERERFAHLVEESEQLAFILDGLVADPLVQRAETCLLTGPGAASVVAALEQSAVRPFLRVAEDDGPAAALRDAVEHPERLEWTAGPADLAIAARALAHRTDGECVELLSDLARWSETAIVIEASRPDGLGAHTAEASLLAFAATGSPLREASAIAALAGAAGWRPARVIPLGWGTEATVLERA
ncbi:siderophore-interacting protein [Agromyces aerolatus]|uniref:siderophore-interacting protein n=1 Tax=Agromyces sp. LY-1074 TaxID=3074080 RepID=UPI00285586C0|nr:MULTISPECIES: siderophore-interacting protein [unclassified Agromyces]MDR5701686.1 siderophore-interacting protein [Agromyces sp. LY-1074]MDR5707967.1 siderophore-interacting protein [Agromyces sp. LY-1358]